MVVLAGEHDLYTAPALRERITGVLEGGTALVIDLTPSTFIDSSVLRVLLEARREARRTRPRLRCGARRGRSPGSAPHARGHRPDQRVPGPAGSEGRAQARGVRRWAALMAKVSQPMRLALAQVNTTVGDIDANAAKIRDYLDRAQSEGAQLVVFPELAINGYPPEDLLLKTHFLDAGMRALEDVAKSVKGIVALVGVRRALGGRLQQPRGARGRSRSGASIARCTCRTTASSTSSGTSRSETRPLVCASTARRSDSPSARTSGNPVHPRRMRRSPAPR